MSNGLKYFRTGQYEWLLKKIKKHLADTENFYRNLCRTSGTYIIHIYILMLQKYFVQAPEIYFFNVPEIFFYLS